MELNSRLAEDHQIDDDLDLGKCLRLAAYFFACLGPPHPTPAKTIFNHAVRPNSVNAGDL